MADSDRPPEIQQQWSTVPLPDGTLPFDPDQLPPLPAKWSAPLADAPADGVWKRFEQVKITCITTICDADLHCFVLTKKLTKTLSPGSCRTCGKLLVSFQRTAERDLCDVDATFAALQRECIRHYFWHVPWGQKGLNYALRKGRIGLESGIEHVVRSRIGDAEPYRDGQQTPIDRDRANAYDYALHAVASCCRRCAQYWHGIPTGRPLDDDEAMYLAELVRRYLGARLPNLQDEPMKVPPIRHQAQVHQMATSDEQVPPGEPASTRHSHAS